MIYKNESGESLKVGCVYESANMDWLLPNPLNRDRHMPNLRKIVASIAANGFLPEMHILVNEKKEIVDGHHRYDAIRLYNAKAEVPKPFYFMLTNLSFMDFITSIPAGHNWTLEDFLTCYRKVKHEPYGPFIDFWLRTGGRMKVSTALVLCNKSEMKAKTKVAEFDFKTGNYVADNIDFAISVWNHVLDFVPICRGIWQHKEFVLAIGAVMMNENYDPKWMLHQLETRGAYTEVQMRKSSYLKSLQSIYNDGLPKEEQLRVCESSF